MPMFRYLLAVRPVSSTGQPDLLYGCGAPVIRVFDRQKEESGIARKRRACPQSMQA